MPHTSSKLLTVKPLDFITGLTCAANARKSCLASSVADGSVVGRALMKLMCGFGLDSFSLSLRWTMAAVSLVDVERDEMFKR